MAEIEIKAIQEYWWRNCITVMGIDIGKKGNPSHISVFAIKNEPVSETEDKEKLIQIHQRFLDNWQYARQADYFNACVEWFNIQRGYLDNTQPVMDERNLSRNIIPIALGLRDGPIAKSKTKLATQFSMLVEQSRIKLLDDDRFLSQILCVTNDLQAPNTPAGHGDAFISIMLAIGVYFDFYAKDRKMGTSFIGNLQDIVDLDQKVNVNIMGADKNANVCRVCGNIKFEELPGGKKKCSRCTTQW